MKDEKLLLSIIIPVYNVEKYVEKCIRSCEEQNVPSSLYEVICVNDGSNDNSLNVISIVAKDYDNIKIIDQPNAGLSEARNTGMKNASGEYYFFVDSDDWISNNCLGEILCKLKSESPDILAIGCVLDSSKKSEKLYDFNNFETCKGKDSLKRYWSFAAQTSIVRAQFMKEKQFAFFPGILHEDVELVPRMHYLAEKMSFLDSPIYHFFSRQGSITRSANPQNSINLLQDVCPRLSFFTESVDPDYKVYFHNLISILINNALLSICKCPSNYQSLINQINYDNRYLWKHLYKSSKTKYTFEYILFILFSKHTITIYKFLNGKVK